MALRCDSEFFCVGLSWRPDLCWSLIFGLDRLTISKERKYVFMKVDEASKIQFGVSNNSHQVFLDKFGRPGKGVNLDSTSISADQQQIKIYTRKCQNLHTHAYNILASFPAPSISAAYTPSGPYP